MFHHLRQHLLNLIILIVVFFAVIFTSITLIKNVQKVRYGFHYILLRLPVLKVLNKASALAFITEYMSLMTASGVTILDSLNVLVESTKNEVYNEEGINRKLLELEFNRF